MENNRKQFLIKQNINKIMELEKERRKCESILFYIQSSNLVRLHAYEKLKQIQSELDSILEEIKINYE